MPMFGICLGMQCLVIEYATQRLRSSTTLPRPSSTRTHQHAAIYKLRDLLGVDEMGGTMRLGAYPCQITEGTLAHQVYGEAEISERHRHRYEVNQKYLPDLQKEHGLVVSGMSPDGKFVEMVELAGPSVVSRLSVPSRVPSRSRPTRILSSSPTSEPPSITQQSAPGAEPPRIATELKRTGARTEDLEVTKTFCCALRLRPHRNHESRRGAR